MCYCGPGGRGGGGGGGVVGGEVGRGGVGACGGVTTTHCFFCRWQTTRSLAARHDKRSCNVKCIDILPWLKGVVA